MQIGSMATDYNALLGQMINSPFATPADRERMVTLLLHERDKQYATKAELAKIERMIKQLGNEEPWGQEGKENSVFNHNPRNMVDFLYQFSVNDSFKWFTHAPDANMTFNYNVYLKNAEVDFNAISKGINSATWYNVRNFIFDTDEETKDAYGKKIDIRWKNLKDWCLEHPNRHPYDVLVGNYKFERYIEIFKNTIQFRTDNSDCLFNKRVRNFFYQEAINNLDIKIDFTSAFRSIGAYVRTYIDVRQFFSFLKIIGKWIVENKSKGYVVELSLEENDDSFTLSIFHRESYLNLDDEKLNGLSGDFHKARNVLLNVADWQILADTINHDSLSIQCLGKQTENVKTSVISKNIIEKAPETLGGVKHLITFYKNIQ